MALPACALGTLAVCHPVALTAFSQTALPLVSYPLFEPRQDMEAFVVLLGLLFASEWAWDPSFQRDD